MECSWFDDTSDNAVFPDTSFSNSFGGTGDLIFDYEYFQTPKRVCGGPFHENPQSKRTKTSQNMTENIVEKNGPVIKSTVSETPQNTTKHCDKCNKAITINNWKRYIMSRSHLYNVDSLETKRLKISREKTHCNVCNISVIANHFARHLARPTHKLKAGQSQNYIWDTTQSVLNNQEIISSRVELGNQILFHLPSKLKRKLPVNRKLNSSRLVLHLMKVL